MPCCKPEGKSSDPPAKRADPAPEFLTTLAPEIQAAILDETLPDTLSLFDLASDTPLSWEEQRGRVA